MITYHACPFKTIKYYYCKPHTKRKYKNWNSMRLDWITLHLLTDYISCKALVGAYWEKLCSRSWVRVQDKGHSFFFPKRTDQGRKIMCYTLFSFSLRCCFKTFVFKAVQFKSGVRAVRLTFRAQKAILFAKFVTGIHNCLTVLSVYV